MVMGFMLAGRGCVVLSRARAVSLKELPPPQYHCEENQLKRLKVLNILKMKKNKEQMFLCPVIMQNF